MSTEVIPSRDCARCSSHFQPTTATGNGYSYCRACRHELYKLRKAGGRIHSHCSTCGVKISRTGGAYRYCSEECKQRGVSRKGRMVCPLIPDVKWSAGRGQWHESRWVSVPLPGAGYRIDHSGRRRYLKHKRTCARCGDTFLVSSPSYRAVFCSLECRHPKREDPGPVLGPKYIPPRDCLKCGDPIYHPKPNQKRHGECSRRHHIARTMELYEAAYSTGRVRQAMRWRYELVGYLRDRDGDDCALCGDRMDFTVTTGARGESDEGPTIDHIVPRSLGGSNDLANLQLAHWRCNRAKGNRVVGFEQLRLVG